MSEKINELSNNLLRRYANAAERDSAKHQKKAERYNRLTGTSNDASVVRKASKLSSKHADKSTKRAVGAIRARYKMDGEETVEENWNISKMSQDKLKFHQKVPHGRYTNKEIKSEVKRRKRSGEWNNKPVKEGVETSNPHYGYHGTDYLQTSSDEKTKKNYANTHKHVKNLTGADDTTVKHYLDSTHGRHLHGNESNHAFIKKDFRRFKKRYNPKDFEESVQTGIYSEDGRIKFRVNEIRSADKKPQNYKDKDGRMRTRMVPVEKDDAVQEGIKIKGPSAADRKQMDAKRSITQAKLDKQKAADEREARSLAAHNRKHAKPGMRSMVWDKDTEKGLDRAKRRKDKEFGVKEDVEQIDELSKNTVQRYANKAQKDISDRVEKGMQLAYRRGNKKKENKAALKKRMDGARRALNRYGVKSQYNESSKQIDELSKNTVRKYVNKAHNDIYDKIDKINRSKSTSIKATKKRIKLGKAIDNREQGIERAEKLYRVKEGVNEGLVKISVKDRNGKIVDSRFVPKNKGDSTFKKAIQKYGSDSYEVNHHNYDGSLKRQRPISEANVDSKLAAQVAARKQQRIKNAKRQQAAQAKKAAADAKPKLTRAPRTKTSEIRDSSDRNIIVQLRKAQDVGGAHDIEFRRGKGRLDKKHIDALLKVHDGLTKPDHKRLLRIKIHQNPEQAQKIATRLVGEGVEQIDELSKNTRLKYREKALKSVKDMPSSDKKRRRYDAIKKSTSEPHKTKEYEKHNEFNSASDATKALHKMHPGQQGSFERKYYSVNRHPEKAGKFVISHPEYNKSAIGKRIKDK